MLMLSFDHHAHADGAMTIMLIVLMILLMPMVL
jgi:hypothetical protein